MSLKIELLKVYMGGIINELTEYIESEGARIVDTVAIQALSEIQEVIKNEQCSDFEAIEQIVMIFEKYRIDFGARHDF